MRRFLLTGHSDGQLQVLPRLQTIIEERRPDGILFAGGISGTNPASHLDKMRTWEKFFTGMGRLGVS
jgi:hypothetical protein